VKSPPRDVVDSPDGALEADPGQALTRRRMAAVKLALFGLVMAGLGAVLAIAVFREASVPPASARARPALNPPRPPLTPAEERYALDLWPIHNEIKASALKATMWSMYYKLRQIDRATLGTEVSASRETYRRAAALIAALRPPRSLADQHAMYAEAVRLYDRAARTMLQVVQDGDDAHLLEAHPISQEAGERLLKVGNVLWPNEYKPN
jgi:hypothetical protein